MRRERARLATLLPLLAFPLLACENEPLGIEDGAQRPTPEVSQRWFRELTIDPFHPTLEAGEALRLTACWRSSSGASVWPVTSPWNVTWVSENPEVVEVTEDGLVRTHSRGLATVRATVTYMSGGQLLYAYSGSTPVGVK